MRIELIHSVGRAHVVALNQLKSAIVASGLPVRLEVRPGHDEQTGARLLMRIDENGAAAVIDQLREIIWRHSA